ncbi:methyl binding domain protein [Striga asiatica]|uniref:Methyl binding domain protein n=1 Tax=Striga asiatica TaxID=4170 RepID=A0A5A7PBZ4_STRAF|nr:methyl binding domain protein [Striga asiatica]
MAGVDSANPVPPPRPAFHGIGIRVDDLKRLNVGQLSQSELQALSSCSGSAFDVRRTDDVVSPQLDRSVFNESAGSRRQTYSRLHHRSHSRLPGPHHSLKPHRQPQPSSDPVTHSIVHFLKHFLNGNYSPPPPPPPPLHEHPEAEAAPIGDLGYLGLQGNSKIKRKRMRSGKIMSEKKLLENGVGVELQGVNGRGEVVDLVELEEKGDELYSEELRRRTVGLETEEDVLGFLSGLEGQWCSRRKKRKYVDAGMFGYVLPIGWKLLLGLRRRDYRFSVYCRRCISPTGQQFLSCKEAASFLKSYFAGNDTEQQREQKTCSIQQAYVLSSGKDELPADKTDDMAHGEISHSALVIDASNSVDIEDYLMGIDNLPEVQVKDIFECFKCNLAFDEKNLYLQHLFSFHQNTTKRYKFGTPVGEDVIIKDGKYECQFCQKVFDERHIFNSHVGVHVRNSGKHPDELALAVNILQKDKPQALDAVPSGSSNMNVSTEIAQNSTFEPSSIVTHEQATADQSVNLLQIEEVRVDSTEPAKIQEEDHCGDLTVTEDLSHGNKIMMEDHSMTENDFSWDANVKIDAGCINNSEAARSGENIDKYEHCSLDMGDGDRCLKPNDAHLEDIPGLTVGDIDFQDAVSSEPLAQSFQFFPTFDSGSNKRAHDFSVVDQKLDNVSGFQELRFEDLDPFKYGFENGQELPSLPGEHMNLGNGSGVVDGFDSSVAFGSDEVVMNTVDINKLTVCVWCRAEFRLEGIESETPSDTIGYMCPMCKAKISGHFGGGGLSMDPSDF